MRVALVTESFLPQVNGVTNTVRHTAERLLATGHQPLVIAPGDGPTRHRSRYGDIPVVRTRSLSLPGYRSFALGLPDRSVDKALAAFDPDVVHLASPIALGAIGLGAARRLGLPTVAVYQTDVSGFVRHYGIQVDKVVDRWVARLHRRCDRTLVPSRASYQQLDDLGVPNLHLWRRGVSPLFDPARRSDELHRRWQPPGYDEDGTVLIGYVGRLAAEKQVRRLVELAVIPGTRLVVIGDGPERGCLERNLPNAVFTGMLGGTELAEAFATLDVFVHPGEAETFCQTVQEAQASGVPVVAPARGGPLDLVDNRRTGILYDPAEPASLRAAVADLVAQPLLRRALADHAMTTTRSWSDVVDELVEVHYPAVLGGAIRRHAA